MRDTTIKHGYSEANTVAKCLRVVGDMVKIYERINEKKGGVLQGETMASLKLFYFFYVIN